MDAQNRSQGKIINSVTNFVDKVTLLEHQDSRSRRQSQQTEMISNQRKGKAGTKRQRTRVTINEIDELEEAMDLLFGE